MIMKGSSRPRMSTVTTSSSPSPDSISAEEAPLAVLARAYYEGCPCPPAGVFRDPA